MLPLLLALAQTEAPRTLEEVPLTLRVNHAIALGVEYLKSQQGVDGSYPFYEEQHPGGATAFVAYTLVKSGVRRNDDALQKALRALAGHEFRSTYSASVHLLLCEALHDETRMGEARRTLEYLLEHQEKGVWGYPWGHLCNSNTQFALLALRAADRMGLEVPEETWLAAVDGLEIFRHRDASYRYEPERGLSYAGITAAALASWAVLEEAARDKKTLRAAVEEHAKKMEDTVAWMESHFDVARNQYTDGTWTPGWHHAYLWAIERWCGLTAREEIAGRDWYAEGARWLVETQRADGSWRSSASGLDSTCFALLFLRRSTVSGGVEAAELNAEIERLRAERGRIADRPGRAAVRITDWMLAGPWTQERGEWLLLEPPFAPDEVRPRPGAKLARREWERVTLLPERWTDLDDLAGAERSGDRQLWVLATWLAWEPPEAAREEPRDTRHSSKDAEGEPVDALLWLDLEDGWDVWLDGVSLMRERRRGSGLVDDVRCPITLTPGEHLLVVLVEDLNGAAAFGAQLTDAANGAPPPGLAASAVQAGKKR